MNDDAINYNPPQVIFLDAVGTLFGVEGSVGTVYAEVAHKFGVEVSTEALNTAFVNSFKTANPSTFPGVNQSDIPALEFEWWQAIATQTFKQAGVINQFIDFSSFFAELYAHFATAEPWYIYPDVLPALETWQSQGIELGIVSNFDTRLYSVLKALDLAKFFKSVTISTEIGAAKPDPYIFNIGLEKHNCQPKAAWHIGDSYKEDYQAAKVVGMRGIWLKRNEN